MLAPDYLAESKAISERYVFLGAWGAGVIEPEFEIQPPTWVHNYFYLIAIRNVATNRWSNLIDTDFTLPWGAGLSVRNEVAKVYANAAAKDPLRRSLDKIGDGFGLMGDLDLALAAVELGMGTGLFPVLKIMASRVIKKEPCFALRKRGRQKNRCSIRVTLFFFLLFFFSFFSFFLTA